MEEKTIKYKFTDTGHWLARCNHETNVIELNRREFPKLFPLFQEYVWIHECVHLLYNVYDEAECNRITDEIFISKAKNEEDRRERLKFLVSSNHTGKSTWIATVVTAVLSIASVITTSIINENNSGYYSLSEGDRKITVDALLQESFTESLLTDTQSAEDIFWSKMSPCIAQENESTFFSWAQNNFFVYDLIDTYEKKFGFAFGEITPINEKAHPQYQKTKKMISGIAIAFALLILMIVLIKKPK